MNIKEDYNKSITYAWFAKPNSGEYRKIHRTEHEQERDCFTLYAGITERSTNERFSGGYKFRYHDLLDRDLDYPEGGKYVIRKREINLVSSKKINSVRTYECSFKEQLYINAVRKAADYLKEHNIKAKVGNISDPASNHDDYFIQFCNEENNGCTYDKKVYNKIIKEVTEYHEEAYLKSDKQNSCDAQLREKFEEAVNNTDLALKVGQEAVEAGKKACELIDKLQKENEKLKEEKEQMEYEYLLTIGSLMVRLFRSDTEEFKKYVEDDTETATSAFATIIKLENSALEKVVRGKQI